MSTLNKHPDSTLKQDYLALTESVGLFDRSQVGRLDVSGADAIDLLNRLSTNDLTYLSTGQILPTILTSNKGRILDVLYVLGLQDTLLVFTGSNNQRKVMEWIDFYTITEDVSIRDITNETAMLSLVGPRALEFLIDLAPSKLSQLSLHQATESSIGDSRVTIVRTDCFSLPGYDIVMDVNNAGHVVKEITKHGKKTNLRHVSNHKALEIVRIERGVPSTNAEIAEHFNPLEAGLKKFISFNKGCYVGQEVVARLNTYDKIQRRLVSLQWDSPSRKLLAPGISLSAQGKQVGLVTSLIEVPWQKKSIGLGYVRKMHAQAGTILSSNHTGEEVKTTVMALASN